MMLKEHDRLDETGADVPGSVSGFPGERGRRHAAAQQTDKTASRGERLFVFIRQSMSQRVASSRSRDMATSFPRILTLSGEQQSTGKVSLRGISQMLSLS